MLEGEIARVQGAIRAWAETGDLWRDCGFKAYLDHVGGEPHNPPVVTVLVHEGHLHRYGEPEAHDVSFSAMLKKLGYWYENLDGTTILIYAENALESAFADYFHWQWVCTLIKEDTADVYQELYDHFARRPDDLHRLGWREFEILLFRIFQNQGFEAVLGPGRNDGGVDLRLWQRDPIGDVLTLVQAKRYAPGNKIDRTEVAALHSIVNDESANRGLFVTTSSYQPAARSFAARKGSALKLAERADIVNWCGHASAGVIADKSTLVARASVKRLIAEVAGRKDPRVLHAHWGASMLINDFALLVKETKHAALLMRLDARTISDDGYGQRGTEVPKFDGATIARLNGEMVWRAKRSEDRGRISYWDGSRLFHPWSGDPEYFDHAD